MSIMSSLTPVRPFNKLEWPLSAERVTSQSPGRGVHPNVNNVKPDTLIGA